MPKNIHNEYPKDWEQWKSKPSYQVPDGYFDELENRLIEKIPTNKQSTWNTKRILLYATSIAAILVISFGINQIFQTDNDSLNYTLSEEEYNEFIEEYSYEIDENTLYSLLEEEEIEALEEQLFDDIETDINFLPTEEELLELL